MRVNSNFLKRPLLKKGSKIRIKKSNEGKFTDYCDGKVTLECIDRGKTSSDPKIRKRATFAENARKWKHQGGGVVIHGDTNQDLWREKYQQLLDDVVSYLNDEAERELLLEQLHLYELDKAEGIGKLAGNVAASFMGLIGQKRSANNQEVLNNLENSEVINLYRSGKIGYKEFKERTGYKGGHWYKRQLSDYLSAPRYNPNLSLEANKAEYTNALNADVDFMSSTNRRQKSILEMQLALLEEGILSDGSEAPASLKKGSKLVHRTSMTRSILDDTGVIDRKTLKLKKNVR